MNEKKNYETAEIRIVLLDRDMLLTSGGTLEGDGWNNHKYEWGDL